jgi:hypothetical protein
VESPSANGPYWTAALPSSRSAQLIGHLALTSPTDEQLELFSSPLHAVSEAMDKINDRWGKFVITPALMMGMQDVILDRIAFGGKRCSATLDFWI